LPERGLPDKRAVRRSFERAAATYDGHDVLQREVARRLLAHLDPIRIEPRVVVDVGTGTGASLAALSKRYPASRIAGVDLSHAMLERAARRAPGWRRLLGARGPALVCADAERLPLASRCAQLAFSNLALQWCRPEAVFTEIARILEPEGLWIFSTFGPDTLKELRAAFAEVDAHEHVHSFVDMHDLGDALVHAGFSDPVMEMEMITVEYETVEAVARDLKAIGATNALAGRPRGLAGRGRWRQVVDRYEKHRRGGALPASWEVIYGHAWKVPAKRLSDGRQVIDFPRGPR
jgi:malonyl-CoA O-methyltransferase